MAKTIKTTTDKFKDLVELTIEEKNTYLNELTALNSAYTSDKSNPLFDTAFKDLLVKHANIKKNKNKDKLK